MKRSRCSKSAIFTVRTTVAVACLASAVLLGVFSFAAGSRSGTRAVSAASQPPFPIVQNQVTNGAVSVVGRVFIGKGWVQPGDSFPIVLLYNVGGTTPANFQITVTLHDASIFQSSVPAPASGDGTPSTPLVYDFANVPANSSGQIAITARAKNLTEDSDVIWKDISASFSLVVGGQSQSAQTHGPKVTTLETARYGDRPFPVVMVQYQDVKHCNGPGTRDGGSIPADDSCPGDHNATNLSNAINSTTSGTSLFQLYHDESFGQLYVEGKVNPAPGSPTTAFTPGYVHKFSSLDPSGVCTGATLGDAYGTPLYANRIENGWYLLPGTETYYGADRTGHALLGAETGQGLLFGIDDACGPPGKMAYDAASVADPDIDYNDYDLDRDGVVDFFEVIFAGDGGNGSVSATGVNNIWPHSSDLQVYFTDADGQTGYVSHDQLRNNLNQLVYWTDATRKEKTTTPTAYPVFVRVGPYNVNPETAVDTVSVIGHEYGHSLGLPDYYSTGTRATFGSYDLNGTDYFQYHSLFSRQELGWIVPQPMPNSTITLRESKFDTGEIHWTRADGTPYTLSGPGIHNADAYRLGLPPRILIDQVPSGTHAWYSGAGNAFGCATDGGGHNLDFFVPDLQQYGSASSVTLKIKHYYEMEWDYDYGFVLISTDGGFHWTSLVSQNSSTISKAFNPNNSGCLNAYDNGITGVSEGPGGNNTPSNPNRFTSTYVNPVFIEDTFDLTPYKGQNVILRFSYATDPGLAKRGWFIDDIEIKADTTVVYSSDFETDDERTRIFPLGWSRISSADGSPQDHAYYLELRDRISNDWDGKDQSERGTPTFEGGLVLYYDDEAHGYGNFGVDDPPGITIVDAIPQPGNSTPNLDDATFNLTRSEFNACTHVENYDAEPGSGSSIPWILPPDLYFKVTSLTGLSPGSDLPASPATATLIADPYPVCSQLNFAPPVLSAGSDYENPDTDGSFTLNWARPENAVGPDLLQIATACGLNIVEDAESGLDTNKWDVTTEGTYAGFNWEAQSEKPNASGQTFRAKGAEGATNAAAILTYKASFTVPTTGITTLEWDDWFVNEGDDSLVVEVSDNGSTGWSPIYSNNRSELANDAAIAFADEGMSHRSVDLGSLQGKTIYFRFRYQLGAEDRAGSTPFGWYIDNIALNNSNWADRAMVDGTSFQDTQPIGSYCYRVQTNFPVGGSLIPSGFSNTVNITVSSASATPTPTPTPMPTATPTPTPAPTATPTPTPTPSKVKMSVTVSPSEVHEGGTAVYTITAAKAAITQTTNVNYSMSGTATCTTDYTLSTAACSGQVTFQPGQTSAQVTLKARKDQTTESTETAIMTLQRGAGYSLGRRNKEATVSILDGQ